MALVDDFDPHIWEHLPRVTAANPTGGQSLSVTSGAVITASAVTRTLSGDVVIYGVPGRTSRGKLRVRPGALVFPADLARVKLTKEHDRGTSRGYLANLVQTGQRIRASMKVGNGPEGDAALQEAADKVRDGFSFDVEDAVIEGDEIVYAKVVAIGQVGIPAYDDLRIDTIAASAHIERETMLTAAQQARLAELRAMQNRSEADEAELNGLIDLAAGVPAEPATDPAPSSDPAPAPSSDPAPGNEPAPAPGGDPAPTGQQVQASRFGSPVPTGVPRPGAQTNVRGGAIQAFAEAVVDAVRADRVTAALADVTSTDHSSIIEMPQWSGELWSGLQYEPQWTDLYSTGDLTALEGKGWRFKTKLVIQDYAGDKVAIPTSTVETEQSPWEAARMAVGVDVDRKFYDFPNAEFIRGLVEQVRESWAIKLDDKVRAYTLAQAVLAEGGVGVSTQPTLLKAAAVAVRALKRRKVGRATFVYVNDDDLFSLLDLTNDDVPAFLELYGIDPRNFRSSQDVPAGTVLAGVRPAAKLRTLPGSPIRASAQNIANGGIDEGFFGYWAMEEHHVSGIAKATYDATP